MVNAAFKASAVAVLIAFGGILAAQEPSLQATLTDAQIEEFLLKAKVVRTRGTEKGITGSRRATLSDGTITHDAHIQSIDEFKTQFAGPEGPELNFRDSWAYNVAAYKIDRLLGLNMVPVSVSRRHAGRPASFTWWVDDVMMDESERLKTKPPIPDAARWNQQMWLLRVFDQLIGNTDRNLGNLLIAKDWRLWAIDHTRAFRIGPTLRSPANVSRCDRQVLERIKALDKPTLQKAIGAYTYTNEIGSLLSRRDEIVTILEKAGPAALFDR